ncbi:Sodium-dependent dicarboxylate transporter SdcS [compost metagenome]
MSELASNTATAALMLPLAGPLASAIGQTPLFLMLPMTLATSLGFMLPTATPPNALALGTRHVSVTQLMLVGLWLNVIGLVLVVGTCYLIGFRVLGATP